MHFVQFTILAIATILAALTTTQAGQNVTWGQNHSGKSTWYSGNDLKGASCYSNLLSQNKDAKDSWHIAAVHMSSYTGGLKAACFECAMITANRRSVVVRIIDECAGCAPNQIDLTKSAFTILAPLVQGVVNTTYQFIKCPSGGSFWPSSPSPKSN